MPSEHGPFSGVTSNMTSATDPWARFADAVREEQARGDAPTIVYVPIAPPSTAQISRLRKLWAMMRLPKYGEV